MIDKNAIVVEPAVKEICALFGIDDPYAAISEGTLIITAKPHASQKIIDALKSKNIPASVVGKMTPKETGIQVVVDGEKQKLEHPHVDPFWNAFYRTLKP